MRFKFERDSLNSYRCCFCCHVRTGTILLGILHLFGQLLVLSAIAVMVLHPELLPKAEKDALVEELYLSDGHNDNVSYDNFNWMTHRKWNSEDKFLALLITVGSFIITTMLIYGSVRGRPGYLMPFFCLQVFDFCITCLTGVGYFSYVPDIKKWIASQELLPDACRKELLQLDCDWLMLMAVVFFALVLIMKAYLIGMVWSCYKYLLQYERNTNSGLIRTYQPTDPTEDTEMLLPPKYEDVIQMPPTPANEPPPPPYSGN